MNRIRALVIFLGIVTNITAMPPLGSAAMAGETTIAPDPVLHIQAVALPLSRLPQWSAMLQRHDQAIGRSSGAAAWAAAVDAFVQIAPARLLREVNTAVNAHPYVADRGDTWSAPLELFAAGGDCEDFAIAKYLLLRDLGVPTETMRIVVMRATPQIPEHAVLVVDTGAGAMVLDNLRALPYAYSGAIAGPMAYAFNESGMWLALGGLQLAAR